MEDNCCDTGLPNQHFAKTDKFFYKGELVIKALACHNPGLNPRL